MLKLSVKTVLPSHKLTFKVQKMQSAFVTSTLHIEVLSITGFSTDKQQNSTTTRMHASVKH